MAGVALALATFLGVAPRVAGAYTIKNMISRGCHEEITTTALRTIRGELATAAPIPASSDEQALIDDLEFTPDSDMMDLGGVTLLLAVRDNDLKGRSSADVTQLAAVHGNPDGQQEHCLRSQDEDEPTGSQSAVAACRAFVRGKIVEALGGLDSTGQLDPNNRTALSVYLSLRGQVDAPLPTYYVKMGQAIHAMEDSFTHTFRTPDEKQITVVLNWIDKVDANLVESRDGPPHASELDRCDDPDSLRTTRHALAIQAVSAVLRGTLDPAKTSDQKMAAVDAVLDEYLGYSPGCTFDNGWCNAPERQYGDTGGCGCRFGRIQGGTGAAIGAGAFMLFAVVRRRRRRSPAAVTGALAVAGAILLTPGVARAQSTTSTGTPAQPATPTTPARPATVTTTTTVPGETPASQPTVEVTVKTAETTTTTVSTPTVADKNAPPPPTLVPVKEPGPHDPSATAWGASVSGSGSLDKLGAAGALGLRLHLSRQWSFGLDGEWNPWLALQGSAVHAGAVNVFGSAMLRFPLAYENFNVRTTGSLGGSYLLSNLYGAPSGSFGPYFGVSFLGLEWKLSRTFLFVINPVSIAVPVPQTRGVPLAYPQYRFTLALEVYLG